MPTYRVGPGKAEPANPPAVRRPLICEHCLEALGNIAAVAAYDGLSAETAAAMWPDMAGAIRQHEQKCRS